MAPRALDEVEAAVLLLDDDHESFADPICIVARAADHGVIAASRDEEIVARVAEHLRMPAGAVERVVAVAAAKCHGVLRVPRDQQVVATQSRKRTALRGAED